MPPQEIPVDLVATGGRLVPPGSPLPPRRRPPPEPAPAAEKPAERATDKPAEKPTDHAPHAAGTFCVFCGWNQAADPQLPPPADVAAFREAVRRGELYSREVDLFGGSAAVTFRDLTADERLAVDMLVAAEVMKNPALITVEGLESVRTTFRLAFAATRVVVGSTVYAPPPVDDPQTTDIAARAADLRRACGMETLYRTVREQYAIFLMRLGAITMRAADRNFFWATGTGGGAPASPSPAPSAAATTPSSA